MRPVKTPSRSALITIVMMVIMLISFCLPAFTQQIRIQENSPAMRVKYIEGNKDALLFNLKYINSSGNDFKLMVLGEGGEILFQENYSGKKIKKKIRLARLTDNDGVIFLIRPAKENLQLSCTVKVPDKIDDAIVIAD
jgi:hypothetical protein